MEEVVGAAWHRFITRIANRSYPEAAVQLDEMSTLAGPLLRAFGGEPGLRVASAGETRHSARRRLIDHIAATGDKTTHAALDSETLRLPERIALFPERARNRELYLWLIALAGEVSRQPLPAQPATTDMPAPPARPAPTLWARARDLARVLVLMRPIEWDKADTRAHVARDAWLQLNQHAVTAVLTRYPGLVARYRRLVDAHLAQRPDPARLPPDEAAAEEAIRAALLAPGSVAVLPAATRDPHPVPLWLMPALDTPPPQPLHTESDAEDAAQAGNEANATLRERKQARREELPDGRDGFVLPFRAESLLSWAEYVRVNRATDEGDEDAAGAAREMDTLAVARGGETSTAKVRFDLDLPAAAQDDLPLGPGIAFPEWDWKRRTLVEDRVRVQPMRARDAHNTELPEPLRRAARRLRAQFSALAPQRRWLRGQQDGPELDLDALVRWQAERAAGCVQPEPGVYAAPVRAARDLACLVMADLSLSTDAHVSDTHKVVDVVRESLLLMGEALDATGDPFAFYGFSSLKRNHVRVHTIKEFDEAYDGAARGRVQALKPGYYTRMGAALRFATKVLGERPNAMRLLLLLTDGKPNDIDHYEGRFAIEDTAAAVREAHRAGLRPFCVTIDREGADYLPHLFGPHGFVVIRDPRELPQRLPQLYAQLTAG